MPVVHLRIDNRLIHGQVTVSWVNSVGADHIIVTNDQVAQDPIQKMMLPQAARGIKTSVLSVDETVDYVNSDKAAREKIMIVAKFPGDALALLEKGVKPQEINVGNQAPIPGTKSVMVTKSIAVTEDQAREYRAIAEKGYNLTAKMMPADPPKNFIELMEKKGL